MANKVGSREIVTSRVIDAPRELVFAAFTEQEHVEKWWVPSGTTTHEWNPKPGGLWRYTMPVRGAPQPFRVKFIEIEKPAVRVRYDLEVLPDSPTLDDVLAPILR